MLDKIKKKIFISTAAAGLLYLAFSIYVDFDNLAAAFARFSWLLIPLLLLLSFTNYVFRFLKWDYYLKVLRIRVTHGDSFLIFMSGLIMSVTPGKFGEVLKSYLLKQTAGTPVSRTAPIVLVERITDFISLILIAVAGAYSFDYGKGIVLGTGVFFILVLVVISSRSTSLFLIKQLGRLNFLKKHTGSIQHSYESSYVLLRPRPLAYAVLISLGSWFFECLGYYIILSNFNINVSLLWASFNYAFATIAGAITLLPGGLGVTEGSLTLMLLEIGTPGEVAVASTLIIRAVTLWFAVLAGIISVTLYQRRFGKIAAGPEIKPGSP